MRRISDKRNQDFENRFADYGPISSENGFRTAGIPGKGFCAYQLQCTSDATVGVQQECESVMLAASNPAQLKFSNERLGLYLQALARVWPHGHIGKCFQTVIQPQL